MKFSRVFFLLLFLPFFSFRNGNENFVRDTGDSAKRADSALISFLKNESVYHDKFVRKVFYSWTSNAQAEQLRAGGPLLRKTVSDSGEISLYDQHLFDKSYDKNPLAVMLRASDRWNKRFAWSNSWAASMGYGAESYGEQLIEITLKDSSILCSFIPGAKEPFIFYKLDGTKISSEEAIRHYDRIAGVYFVKQEIIKKRIYRRKHIQRGTFIRYKQSRRKFKFPSVYREFVLINESMIARWEIGAQGVKTNLYRDIRQLEKLKEYLDSPLHTPKSKSLLVDSEFMPWAKNENSNDIQLLYESGLCFADDTRYFCNPYSIGTMLDILKERWKKQAEPVIRFNPK